MATYFAGQVARVESSSGAKRVAEEKMLRKLVLQMYHIKLFHICVKDEAKWLLTYPGVQYYTDTKQGRDTLGGILPAVVSGLFRWLLLAC